MKISKTIRILIGLLSIVFLFLAGSEIISIIKQILQDLAAHGLTAFLSITLKMFIPTIIYSILFVTLLTIAIIWSDIFKSITKQLIGFGTIFITISFILFPISNHAHEMSQSVQPMIDSMAIEEIEQMLTQSNIPAEALKVLGIDFSVENQTQKANQLKNLRESCTNNEIQVKELCEGIMLTDYDHLMKTMRENPQFLQAAKQLDSENSLPDNLSFDFEGFGSIEEIETTMQEYETTGYKLLFFGILLILLALPVYYLHFKAFKRELLPIHIPYFVAKTNLIYFVPSFILLAIFYWLIKSEILINYLLNSTFLETLENIFNASLYESLEMLINSPLYEILLQINQEIFNLNLIYLIVSIIAYIIFYILIKKKLDSYQEPSQTEEENKE